MPLYTIEHSFPLTLQQKTDLAERITKLHAHTFTTPSVFVQVKFYQQDTTSQNHFVAGALCKDAINRVIAYVRSGPSRSKESWDKLAKRIEHSWYVALGEALDEDEEPDDGDKEKQKKDVSKETAKEKNAKELLSVAFITGIVVREKGYAIPEAGGEEAWIKQFREEFEHKADLGDESWKGMLEEIDARDDLKAWRGTKKYGGEEKEKEKKKEAEQAAAGAEGEKKETTQTKEPAS